MSRNTCDCPKPPGGRVVCEAHQLAVCRVKDGQATHHCVDQKNYRDSVSLLNWTYEQITGNRGYNALSTNDLFMLASGEFSEGDTRVTFNLPDNIKSIIEQLLRGNSEDDGLLKM